MLVNIFAVLDLKSAAFGVPFFSVTRGSALRGLEHQLKSDVQNMMALYPADFVLYDLGTWDDVSGIISPLTTPTMIMTLADLMGKVPSAVSQPQEGVNVQ